MRLLSVSCLTLLCALILQSAVHAEEPDDGRVRLYIKAGDPSGGKLSFNWKQVDGPEEVKIANPTAAVFENGKWVSDTYFIPTLPGKYAFEVTVKNEAGDESKKIIVRPVLPPAPPPTAIAGKDQDDKRVGEIVRVNGGGSKPAEGRAIAEWEWRVVQAPDNFKIDPKLLKERQFDFKAEQTGSYQFELRVSDGKRWSEPSRVMITVKAQTLPPKIDDVGDATKPVELPPVPNVVDKKVEIKPVVNKGGTIKIGETIVLDGSKSVIDESVRPEFFWRLVDGPFLREFAPDRSKPYTKDVSDLLNFPVWNCKPTQSGEYTFELEITARQAGKKEPIIAKSEKIVFKVLSLPDPTPVENKQPKVVAPTVENNAETTPVNDPPAQRPTAKIFAERRTVEVGDMVKLDGSKSKPGKAGGKLEYIWGPVPGKKYPAHWAGNDGPQVEFRADEEGEYSVALIVKEGTVFSEASRETITVGPANQPPIVKLARKYECAVGDQLRLEAEINDPENDPVDVKWSCIDPADLVIPDRLAKLYDPATKTSTVVFVPKNPGTYVFQITVTDGKGRSETAKTQVGVKDEVNRPPVAIVDGPNKAVAPGTKIKLSGIRSNDPEKKPLSYIWKQELEANGLKIPGNVPGEKDKEWVFTPTEAGKYVVQLVVFDGVHKSEPDRFELNVVKGNAAPVAKIVGPPTGKIIIGEQAGLDGSKSSDPDNDKLTYKWRKLDGKGEVVLAGEDEPRATIKAKSLGAVRIELVVNDGTTDSEPEIIDLMVSRPNTPPVAKITGPTMARAGSQIDLTAAESTDPEGDELSYIWSQAADGGPEIGVRGRDLRKKAIRFRADKPGTYVVTLEVVDAEGLKSDPATHKLEVKGVNRPPRAMASRIGNEHLVVGSEVKLSARGSLDPEGSALTYKWKQISGDPIALADDLGEVVNLAVKAPGNYEFECVVNDGENDSEPARVAFSVHAPNSPPVALVAEVPPADVGERIILDGSASKDADNDKLEYKWSQASGPADAKFAWRGQNKSKTEVVLPKDGEYVFELKVFDQKEWSEPKKVVVRTRAQNAPPVAAITSTEIRTEENVETILDGSNSSDPDKGPQPLKYIWRQTSGSRVDLVAEGPVAKFTPKRSGNATFELKVFDGKSESAPETVKVEVLKSGSLPVAVAEAKPNPVKAAQKGQPNNPNILILDGTRSRSKAGALTYQWKQVSGEDLRLRPADMAKSRVGIRMFLPGIYRFMLTVSDGQNTGLPSYVEVKVVDESGAGAVQPEPKNAPPENEPPKQPEKQTTAPAPEKRAKAPATEEKPESRPSASNDGALLPPPKDSNAASNTSANEGKAEKELSKLDRKADPEAEKKLIAALSSEDADVRGAAAAALYRRGINSIPALIGVLENGDALAKKEAQWALRELTHESFGADAGKWKKWWKEQPASKNHPLESAEKN